MLAVMGLAHFCRQKQFYKYFTVTYIYSRSHSPCIWSSPCAIWSLMPQSRFLLWAWRNRHIVRQIIPQSLFYSRRVHRAHRMRYPPTASDMVRHTRSNLRAKFGRVPWLCAARKTNRNKRYRGYFIKTKIRNWKRLRKNIKSIYQKPFAKKSTWCLHGAYFRSNVQKI